MTHNTSLLSLRKHLVEPLEGQSSNYVLFESAFEIPFWRWEFARLKQFEFVLEGEWVSQGDSRNEVEPLHHHKLAVEVSPKVQCLWPQLQRVQQQLCCLVVLVAEGVGDREICPGLDVGWIQGKCFVVALDGGIGLAQVCECGSQFVPDVVVAGLQDAESGEQVSCPGVVSADESESRHVNKQVRVVRVLLDDSLKQLDHPENHVFKGVHVNVLYLQQLYPCHLRPLVPGIIKPLLQKHQGLQVVKHVGAGNCQELQVLLVVRIQPETLQEAGAGSLFLVLLLHNFAKNSPSSRVLGVLSKVGLECQHPVLNIAVCQQVESRLQRSLTSRKLVVRSHFVMLRNVPVQLLLLKV